MVSDGGGDRRAIEHWLLLLIAGTALLRLALAWLLGLGIDESYMVAAGRTLRLGYFDHPPASWWLAWAGSRMLGTEAAWAVRLPFIALFALSTWLMYQLTKRLVSARAGLWASVALNCAPVFGITTGGWVLPDGPLIASLLGAALCLAHALPRRGGTATAWWLMSGLCAGLALFSKYSAILTVAGVFLYLLTNQSHRFWLRRPEPYAAAAVALLIFSPVLAWNAAHAWASFAFQGERASGSRLHPLAPIATLGGEALFLLPWIWAGLLLVFVAALRRGPRAWQSWLLACLAAPPIVLFALVGVWSGQRVLWHWAAPGYLMLFPLLGGAIEQHRRAVAMRVALWLTPAFVLLALMVAASQIAHPWIPGATALGAEARDWTELRSALAARGLLGQTIAAIRWQDAGKIDYALHGAARVICLSPDARQYRFASAPDDLLGRDLLIVMPEGQQTNFARFYAILFASNATLPPVEISASGHPVLTLALVRGHDLQRLPDHF